MTVDPRNTLETPHVDTRESMPHDSQRCSMCDEQHDLIRVLRDQTIATERERERLQRAQEAIALAAVRMMRNAQAMLADLEEVQNRLAGITRYGDEP